MSIWLSMTWNHGQDEEREIYEERGPGHAAGLCLRTATDDGLTWSRPREITTAVKRPEWRWYATGPGVGIQLSKAPGRDGS